MSTTAETVTVKPASNILQALKDKVAEKLYAWRQKRLLTSVATKLQKLEVSPPHSTVAVYNGALDREENDYQLLLLALKSVR